MDNDKIADQIWWTRKARIQTEARILFYARHAKLLVLWYSLSAVVVSVYYAVIRENSEFLSATSVSFSILVLMASATLNGLNHEKRASLVKECYEKLKELHSRAKHSSEEYAELLTEYNSILAVCENHTNVDYYAARCEAYLSAHDKSKIDPHPTRYIWLVIAFRWVLKYASLIFLYVFPPALFTAIHFILAVSTS